ncbi:MAG: hypothetical protein HQL16_00855 [Candidatus Omnitrophica bacterium]|nr:hypothetical protein [Candidatus Omnitrophota bacterium]
MKKIFLLMVILATVFVLSAKAQIVPGKYDVMTGAMDRTAALHNAMYSDVPKAGANEDAVPQAERYDDMVKDMNRGVDHHFEEGSNYQSIIDTEAKK